MREGTERQVFEPSFIKLLRLSACLSSLTRKCQRFLGFLEEFLLVPLSSSSPGLEPQTNIPVSPTLLPCTHLKVEFLGASA